MAATLRDTIHYLIASLRQFAVNVNVPLYVMATGYDIDIAPSQWYHFSTQCNIVVMIDFVVTKVLRTKNKFVV